MYLVLGISRLFPLSNFFLSADKSIAKERKASKMLCRQDSNSRPLDQKYIVRRLNHVGFIRREHFKNYIRKVYFCRQKTGHQKTDPSITAPLRLMLQGQRSKSNLHLICKRLEKSMDRLMLGVAYIFN